LTEGNIEAEFQPVVAGHSRLWLAQVDVELQDSGRLAERWLNQRYSSVLDFSFAYNSLTLFVSSAQPAQAQPTNLRHSIHFLAPLGPGLNSVVTTCPPLSPGPGYHLIWLSTIPRHARYRPSWRWWIQRGTFWSDVYWPCPRNHGHASRWTCQCTLTRRLVHITLKSEKRPPTPLCHWARYELRPHIPCSRQEHHLPSQRLLGGQHRIAGIRPRDSSGRLVDAADSGQTLVLDLYWQARDKVSRDLHVFAHLVGQAYNPLTAGPVWAGHDSQPLTGEYPTTQWFIQDPIVDRHLLVIDPQAPTGEYELEVGMYLLDTMKRLEVTTATGPQRMAEWSSVISACRVTDQFVRAGL